MDEQVLFEDRGVRITTVKAQISGTTYPIAGITSVRSARLPPAPIIQLMLFGVGALEACAAAGLMGVAVFVQPESGDELFVGGLVIGGIAAVFFWMGSRPSGRSSKHAVIIGTAGGDRKALTTPDEVFAGLVRTAIEEAITRRG